MSRVAFLLEQESTTSSSMRLVFKTLFEGTTVEHRFYKTIEFTKDELAKTDVLVLVRPDNYLTRVIAQNAVKAGCFVIFFMDDDLLNLPLSMPRIPWRQNNLKKALQSSHAILSSSPYIADKYKEYTLLKRGIQINTAISEDELTSIPEVKPAVPVKIVYAAGAGHKVLFDKYIRPVLPELDRRYGKQISLTFVGVHPDLDVEDYTMPIRYQKGMPMNEYRKFMIDEKFAIGLAPLHNDDFSKCKYFNKFLEYTVVGTVGIYSNCEPYTYVVESGKNGILVDNTEDTWLEGIERLLDEKLRETCIQTAIKQLKEQFNSIGIRDKLFSDIPELQHSLIKREPGNWIVQKMVYRFSRIADRVYLVLFFWKRTGFKGVIKKIQNHFSEKKAYKYK